MLFTVKIIWQEDETAKGPFLEEPIAEEELLEEPIEEEAEQSQPSAGQGFGW